MKTIQEIKQEVAKRKEEKQNAFSEKIKIIVLYEIERATTKKALKENPKAKENMTILKFANHEADEYRLYIVDENVTKGHDYHMKNMKKVYDVKTIKACIGKLFYACIDKTVNADGIATKYDEIKFIQTEKPTDDENTQFFGEQVQTDDEDNLPF